MYRCKTCKKEFPVVAWLESTWTTESAPPYQAFGVTAPADPKQVITSTIKKPCCPFCHQIEIEVVKDET